jgi:hypothetical protein
MLLKTQNSSSPKDEKISYITQGDKYQRLQAIALQTLMLLIPISIITGFIAGAWIALLMCSLGMPLTLVYLKLSELANIEKKNFPDKNVKLDDNEKIIDKNKVQKDSDNV